MNNMLLLGVKPNGKTHWKRQAADGSWDFISFEEEAAMRDKSREAYEKRAAEILNRMFNSREEPQ